MRGMNLLVTLACVNALSRGWLVLRLGPGWLAAAPSRNGCVAAYTVSCTFCTSLARDEASIESWSDVEHIDDA